MPVPDPVGPSPIGSGSGGAGSAQLESLISAIEQKLKELVNAVNAFIKQADSILSRVPGMAAAAGTLLRELYTLQEELTRAVTIALVQSHTAGLMWMAANTWGQIASQAGTADQAIHRLSDASGDWQGVAGRAYATSASNQRSAVGTYQGKADSLQSDCYAVMANALAFYSGVLAVVGGAIAGIAGGLVGGTAVGGPAGGITGAVAGAAVGAILGALVALGNLVGELVWANFITGKNIRQILQPNGDFDGKPRVSTIGGWPQGAA